MKYTARAFALFLCLMGILGNMPVLAQSVPRWVVGTFQGYNPTYKSDMELTITSSGQATARVRYPDGKRFTQKGTYDNGTLTLDNFTFYVERTTRGMKVTQSGGSINIVNYRRIGGGGGSGGIVPDRSPDNVPSWAIGTFKGFSQKYNADMELRISPSGTVKCAISYRDGRHVTSEGTFSGTQYSLTKFNFNATKTSEGFRSVQVNDRTNEVSYRRVGGEIEPENVPSWAIGTFKGFSQKYNADMELRISPSGTVKCAISYRDGRHVTSEGTFSGTQYSLTKFNFNATKTSEGFRSVQVNDRTNEVSYRRVGGGLPDAGNVIDGGESGDLPSWAIGTFEGYDSKSDADTELTVSPSGRATANIRYRDGHHATQSGEVNQNELSLEDSAFTITKTRNGFTATQKKDVVNTVNYRRISGGVKTSPANSNIPTWVVGTFQGYNPTYKSDMELTITSSGQATAQIRYPDGKRYTQHGQYRSGKLKLDKYTFNVERKPRGFRLRQDGNKGTTTTYRRI